jgi:hypothetical protein
VNAFWQNPNFHNYADYAALSDTFRLGLNRLRGLGHASPVRDYVCGSGMRRCRRPITLDYLIANGTCGAVSPPAPPRTGNKTHSPDVYSLGRAMTW